MTKPRHRNGDRFTLDALFAYGETESYHLWASSEPGAEGQKVFAHALDLPHAALIAATAENPLDASAVDFKTTAGRLTGQPRMKIEALAHFVRRARQNGASITLTAFRE
ncbi:MAG TPA: hypothetical protein P5256_01645 [Beijerinckiaceae bacterium]|nr:hypothetical protein [Rhodoblastus sp.]MCC2106181.1 hypothetical protein [Hyphomicrobiales bacterium]HRY01799.1 hypothetical protein [Beijerinckiaceae bacterium]